MEQDHGQEYTCPMTITKFEVSRVVSLMNEIDEKELVRLASGLEQHSEHPIATGIIQKAKDLPARY